MSSVTINGRPATLPDDPDALLADVLRDDLALTGTKLVCGAGVCGACTVLLDGVPVVSCLTPAKAVAGRQITTVEGIGATSLHPVQKAFMALDALQCGFCTPGFIVEAAAFHDGWRKAKGTAVPSREEIGAALSGHLCRCGAYESILRAVADACAGRFDGESRASPRIEARDKVTGAAKYTLDIRHEGQLEGLILRSQAAHAKIVNIDFAAALAIPGVKAAVSLLGEDKTVRFVGEQIAAVAAKDRKTALQALDAIKITSETLPAAIGLDAARKPGAPEVFPGKRKNPGNVSEGAGGPAPWKGNVRGPTNAFSHKAKKARTWVDDARTARDPLLVEGVFHTGTQSHTCLEPHAAVARFDGDQLTLHVSTQAVFHLKELVAKRFKFDVANIRVIAEHVGGGFGSKASLGNETIAAIELARAAKAPVRVAFDRHEELTVTGYRPAAEMKIALLPSADGALKAVTIDLSADTGAAINSTIAGLARLIYPAEAKHLADFDVVSNLPPGAAFRGPGGPPMAFALEQAVDEAALRLNTDPIALRKRWDTNPNRQRLYDWALQLDAWKTAKARSSQSGRYRYGIGVATGYWLYLWQPKSKVELAIENHRLVASVAVQDIGTGTRSVIANTVARAFDLEPHEVDVRIGDFEAAGGTSVRRQPGHGLGDAADADGDREAEGRDPQQGGAAAGHRLERAVARPDRGVARHARPRPRAARTARTWRPAFARRCKEAGFMGIIFGWMMRWFSNIAVGAGVPSSVQVVEVEVDTWLGHVKVLKVHTGIAVGKVAAPDLARSQATGSVVQGIGYALYEGREVDPASGNILTVGLEDYRIPGIADTPLIDVHFDEGGFGHVMGGSVGIGEVATVPTSAAIANAIRNAIGVRPQEIPIRPDRLLELLKGRAAA